MTVLIPTHFNSGNRGCEAISRGTEQILTKQYKIIEYSSDIKSDCQMGAYKSEIRRSSRKNSFFRRNLYRVLRKITIDSHKKKMLSLKENYDFFLKELNEFDNKIVLSTGGDMFCYGNNDVIWLNDYLYKQNIKTVLWGCSIGKENLTPEKVETLKKFALITARETITEQLLKEDLQLENVRCFPDPAFVLEAQSIELPDYFDKKEIIGINLSNFVGQDVSLTSMFGKNLLKMIDFIIEQTSMDILLIPHVFWRGQDDRQICDIIYRRYIESKRVHLLDSQTLNYCQIRYVISKCKFFIGARTHAMISAYSTHVPALALGYSVKSIGIAKDIGIPEELVVNYKNLKRENELLEAFIYLRDHESDVKCILERNMPEYRNKAYQAKVALDELLV